MFDPLLWVLHHFITHYAGQTTQGNTNEGDGVDQVSGFKDAPKQDTDLPLKVHPLRLKRPLQESNPHDQSGTSSSTDFRPKKVCKGRHAVQQISSPCPQQQSQPSPSGSQPSTSYDHSQSNEMPLPAYLEESKVESYCQSQNHDQYNAFIAGENKYFRLEYSRKKKLGEGSFGVVRLAIKKSNGFKVAYKSIPKSKVDEYALESIPPLICHLRNPLVGFDEQSVAQCMSSRPSNILLPYEFALQMYLSRPGHENPYVPTTFDYIVLKKRYILVMEHLDEKWVNLFSYVKKKKRLEINDARDIVKEIVKAMISLKQYGILHDDLHGRVKLIDFGQSDILPGWEEGKSVPLKSSDPPSTVLGYRAEDALDPGVENVYTWLRGGVLNGEADLDQRWLDGIVEHESMGTRHDNRALAARLADFLQVAYRQYQSTLCHNTTGIILWKLAN
ncbi:hypothetical protein BASA50_003019 [Batrachochytrium salamandrivorans]|uniref:non-specific serine/threonine protein kinase n=1 Tax=Batrachochytrium salamandrivorans TaxID=1357716 RepID=A0ABQ8FJS4_9FUNG|nr:hypothetical protein BASA50_003019 [Batrachochytrium salamandrivorans]KAH9277009.1 hypothetical protein BASA83_000526 [Batrachochytrium salamandrivorans]